jgi:hypothetical protein
MSFAPVLFIGLAVMPSIRQLKLALSFSVTDYGLKSVAWIVFVASSTTIHATGFSQWLMME